MCMFQYLGPIEMASTPYNIARIIEFLPPHTSPKKGSRMAPSSDVMVRLSLYYRPSDISARNVADFRLLLAAIHTDIQPISNVRGKCYVRHKDRIPDLLEWKRSPDHFYFVKFFDPYIKREFEVIRTASVSNVPATVKEVLLRRYEYLITEREMVADLMDTFRNCCRCNQWSSFQDSVKCESCREHYHMSCLQPPLLAKPAKGYSWVCPSCVFQHNTQTERQKAPLRIDPSGSSKPRGTKSKRKLITSDFTPDTMFRGWPWRYFGSGRRHISSSRHSLADYMEHVKRLHLVVPPWDLERLNLALSSYTSMGREAAYSFMCHTVHSDFRSIHFTEEESVVFEEELERNGGLDVISCSKILKRSTSDILRYSYLWKNGKLKDENEALRQHRRISISHARQNRTLGAPSLGKMRIGDKSEVEDDEKSIYAQPLAGTGSTMVCVTCSTKISQLWWRCPRTVPGIAMCESCGSSYRKYGVISFARSEDIKKSDRKEHVSKKGKNEFSHQTAGSIWSPKSNHCACCRRVEPKSQLFRCRNCCFIAHTGCYGIASSDQKSDWECELCSNEKKEECPIEPRCVLCPRTPHLTLKKKIKNVTEYDLLAALKPSEGRHWAHLLCSTWTNGVEYANATSFKQVEGIMNIGGDRWMTACSLCGQSDGAVINCSDCDIQFHVSCAWLSGLTLGFEFNLAKPGKSHGEIVIKFKDSEGVMSAGVWCKSHDLSERVIHGIFDVEPDGGETAFQVYIGTYKSPTWNSAFPLLRKARRLELIIPSSLKLSSSEETKKNVEKCDSCGVSGSPMWHKHNTGLVQFDAASAKEAWRDTGIVPKTAEDGQGQEQQLRLLCHLCWFENRK
uniref:ZNF1 n=1 Tax=Cryptococcus gattii TaxID=552467 RepID=F6KJS4_CRYGA|nr:ZNF1 [Cryptococcus gattii]